MQPSHIISHITDFALQNHLHSHKRGIAHVICKSQIVAPDANRCTAAKCHRGSGQSQHQTLKWFETVSKGGAEFASEPNIGRASIFNGMEKKEKKSRKGGETVAWPAHPSFFLKVRIFVGGIGKSSELQMQRTAGYFPLPWPAKESSFKAHLPVNILAWLWVISPVSSRPSRAWRCTCANPKTDPVSPEHPLGPTTSHLIKCCSTCSVALVPGIWNASWS